MRQKFVALFCGGIQRNRPGGALPLGYVGTWSGGNRPFGRSMRLGVGHHGEERTKRLRVAGPEGIRGLPTPQDLAAVAPREALFGKAEPHLGKK